MLTNVEIRKKNDLFPKQIITGFNLPNVEIEALAREQHLGEVLKNQLSQLGPAIDDPEAAGYASVLLQMSDPAAAYTRSADQPEGQNMNLFIEGQNGYFASSDDLLVHAALSLGPAIDDEEISGYIGRSLA